MRKTNDVYTLKEMTVADFIAVVGSGDVEKSLRDMPLNEQIEFMIGMVQRSFPDMPRELLEGMSVDMLMAIISFIQGELVEEAQDAAKKSSETAGENSTSSTSGTSSA